MRIVVIGGTGLIGSKLVTDLAAHGHEAVPASPGTGVNTLTGEGLSQALAGADVVVDVSNSPSFEDTAVLEFFETSTRNILDAEAAAHVGQHVALSVVGTDRLAESGYMRAKIAQEKLIADSSIGYTIVHATQFFEFAVRTADEASDGGTVRVPPVLIQPMAADDVAAAVCGIALAAPLNDTIEIAGPEPMRFEDFVRRGLRAAGDQRVVVTDSQARYFGARLSERTLLPGASAQLGATTFDDWLSHQAGADAVLGETRYRSWVGRAPAGDNAFLHELEVEVTTELILAETTQPEEAVSVPINEWLSDPADDQRYEAGLRSLLGAVETLEDGSHPETEGS